MLAISFSSAHRLDFVLPSHNNTNTPSQGFLWELATCTVKNCDMFLLDYFILTTVFFFLSFGDPNRKGRLTEDVKRTDLSTRPFRHYKLPDRLMGFRSPSPHCAGLRRVASTANPGWDSPSWGGRKNAD